MNRLLRIRPWIAFLIYVVIVAACLGLGMTVPIFCILFGFVVGWYCARRALQADQDTARVLRTTLINALVTTAVTFIAMAAIYIPQIPKIFDPATDFTQLGMPLILYEPRPSFFGWLLLMVIISPFLQLLTTIFGAYLTMLHGFRKIKAG